jgi:Flagellin and related hook-associated proteins
MEVRSTLSMNTLLSSRMAAAQAQIQKLQGQVASGQRADTYAELGTQAGINIALHNEADAIETYQVNNEVIGSRMAAMDQAMIAIHDAAESVKSEAYALTPSDTPRTALINSATVAFNTVVNALQTSVGGRALFSGDQTGVTPIVSSVFADLKTAIAGLPTPGDATAVQAEIQNFFNTPSSFYQGGTSIRPSPIDRNITVDYGILASDSAFRDALQGLATIALTPKPDGVDTTDAEYTTVIQSAAATLSSGVGQLNQLISSNGTNQALVEGTNEQHAASLSMLQQQINTIEQTDMAEAASLLAQLRTQLEATYTMTAQLNQLSLVNYLR